MTRRLGIELTDSWKSCFSLDFFVLLFDRSHFTCLNTLRRVFFQFFSRKALKKKKITIDWGEMSDYLQNWRFQVLNTSRRVWRTKEIHIQQSAKKTRFRMENTHILIKILEQRVFPTRKCERRPFSSFLWSTLSIIFITYLLTAFFAFLKSACVTYSQGWKYLWIFGYIHQYIRKYNACKTYKCHLFSPIWIEY